MKIAGVILAAGLSSRMGGENKLLKIWRGKPLIDHVLAAASASRLEGCWMVTGHDHAGVAACAAGRADVVHNPAYEEGLASSLRAGVETVEATGDVDGIVVLLGDMPLLTSDHIDQMIGAFNQGPRRLVVASQGSKKGNPVLFGRSYFDALKVLTGDRGARSIIDKAESVHLVDIGEASLRDFDTPDRFHYAG